MPQDLSIYTTSLCDRNCAECIMRYQREADLQYHMSIAELQRLVGISEASDYSFNFILTGGEPLLWENLHDGVVLLRRSRVCQTLTLFTNALAALRLRASTVASLDEIRISAYDDNHDGRQLLRRRYPHKVRIVPRERFWQLPSRPLDGVLPADCMNPEVLYYRGQIYACPHSASLIHITQQVATLATPLEVGYLSKIAALRSQQGSAVCRVCISNRNVRQRLVAKANRRRCL